MYSKLPTSFLKSTLLNYKDEETAKREIGSYPLRIRESRLGNISYLYQYVNVPPLAVGVPAPKVAESVLRSFEYNKLPNNGLGETPTQTWLPKDGNYPMDDVTSNFSPHCAEAMYKKFLLDNQVAIDGALEKLWEHLCTTNSDVLTRGRQTWDPINQRSVPSAQAYKEQTQIYDENLQYRKPTILGFLQCFHSELNLEDETLTHRVDVAKETNYKDPRSQIIEKITVTRTVVKKETIKQPELRNNVMDRATSFCAYLKGRERGKLSRRAISSANMVLRMHLYVIEKLHLFLCRGVQGSVVGIGGDEKKNKIIKELDSITAFQGEEAYIIQATEDASKWNECLAPENFALFHDVIMDNKVRQELEIPLLSKEMGELRHIFAHTFYLLSKKRIWMGKGHLVSNETEMAYMTWTKECIPMMGERTKEWFEKAEPHLDGKGYLKAPYGMLMGMLNAASTTMGLAAVNWRQEKGTDCKTVRSSDDSMTIFSANTLVKMFRNINRLYDNLRLLGINISTKKTRFFRQKFGEMTSWYMDGEFTAQYGVETSSLRPQGGNPPDDFHNAAIQTATSLRSGNINLFGAQMRLCLSLDNSRRLWKINKTPEKRPNISGDVLVLSDGGLSPWNWSNCHLPELPLKERLAQTDEEKEYLYKVMNPLNPFTAPVTESTSYSVELGTMVDVEMEIPRNLFHSIKRSNRTQRSVMKEKENKFRRLCDIVNDTFEAIDPVSALITPKSVTPMAESMITALSAEYGALHSIGVEFTPEEQEELEKAIDLLQQETINL
uniref:RNA-directed RNA polymerase catalytic subunit n=1 Tax=Uumaja virus TaxID=2739774 RepID=A0A859D174_9ORTO|nr:PB1 [Uumaja virus]